MSRARCSEDPEGACCPPSSHLVVLDGLLQAGTEVVEVLELREAARGHQQRGPDLLHASVHFPRRPPRTRGAGRSMWDNKKKKRCPGDQIAAAAHRGKHCLGLLQQLAYGSTWANDAPDGL